MRTIKRLTATFLSLLMVMMMIVPVHAADGNYSIKITTDEEGHTYTAYQIFAGTVATDEGQDGDDAGPALTGITWGTGIQDADGFVTALQGNATIGDRFAGITSNTASNVAEALKGATAEELSVFIEVLTPYLNDANARTTSQLQTDASGSYYLLDNLPGGYYLVTDSGANARSIVQVLGNVTMEPKSSGDIPTVEKKVQEEDISTAGYGYGYGFSEVADHEIGEYFQFKLIGSIPDMTDYETYEYIFHDTMSSGLSLYEDDGNFHVYLTNNVDANQYSPEISQSSYSLTTSTDAETGITTITIDFDDLKQVENVENFDYVVVTYYAELNENAVIGSAGNVNNVYLEYTVAGGGTDETLKEYAIVFAWTLSGVKVDGDMYNTEDPDAFTSSKLSGAKFVLLKNGNSEVATVDASGRLTGWVKLDNTYSEMTVSEWEAIAGAVLTSNDIGGFSVLGLDDDTYYLYEIEAPEGYNRLENLITLDVQSELKHEIEYNGINSEGMITSLKIIYNGEEQSCTQLENGRLNFTIANYKGATLPETGGMGTTIFYIVGGLLVVGAGVVLIVRIRMRSSDSDHTDE